MDRTANQPAAAFIPDSSLRDGEESALALKARSTASVTAAQAEKGRSSSLRLVVALKVTVQELLGFDSCHCTNARVHHSACNPLGNVPG